MGQVFGVLRALAALGVVFGPAGCRPDPLTETWTCDWDARVARPLADPGARADEAGALPPGECASTCGPPVSICTRTDLDGGRPGAVCPVCTF